MTRHINISKFKGLEMLETTALEEIILADFNGTAKYDENMIEYVLELLVQRKQMDGDDQLPDVNTAWKHLREKLAENNGLAESLNTQPKKKREIKSRVGIVLRRLVAAAACLSLCFSSLLAAPPEPKNTSDLYALWGNGTFRYVSEEEYLANYERDHEPPIHTFSANKDDYSEIDPRLTELFKKTESVQLPTILLPRWFPGDCHVIETDATDEKPYSLASIYFEWDEESTYTPYYVLMMYDCPVDGKYLSTLQGIYPELYTSGQFTFFVFSYKGTWCAIWRSLPYEITIFGIDTKENLLKVIDSIQGGYYE